MRVALLAGVLALTLGGTSGCDSKTTPAAGGTPQTWATTGAGTGDAGAQPKGRFPKPPK